jgi:H/ACA ribonucleoprotein complex subunit 3
MHLMYYLDSTGTRVYTLKVRSWLPIDWRLAALRCATFESKFSPLPSSVLSLQKETPDESKVTESAHPARFSPDDKFSAQRVACKKRFGIYFPSTPQKPF